MQNLYKLPTRVYIEDTDAGGIVFYVNYLKYMERARTEFMRQLGYDKAAIVGEYLLVVHSTTIQYRRPATLDDELIVTAAISELGKARAVFTQTVLRGDELLCEASVTIACVKGGSMRPTPFPADMADKLTQRLNQ
ncbi:MAG: tol-pal system-associated acyl-CoA thioesterase [Cellvibrionaceae bacterium]